MSSDPEDPRHTEIWNKYVDTNQKGFWDADPDRFPEEHEDPTTLETIMLRIGTGPQPKITEKQRTSHRAPRPSRRRVWVFALIGGVSVATLVGIAWAGARPATPHGEKTLPAASERSVEPTPQVVMGPTATAWRTQRVEIPGPVKPGPTVTRTVFVTPTPKVMFSRVPGPVVTKTYQTVQEVEVPVPGPTVTKTVEVKVCFGYRPRTGELVGEIECP